MRLWGHREEQKEVKNKEQQPPMDDKEKRELQARLDALATRVETIQRRPAR
jgi:hypothetical protein